MPTEALGATLLRLARAAIAAHLGLPSPSIEGSALAELAQPGATFVTLTQNGALRGCIGSLLAHRPLADDVTANALAAAFRDPRFAPLTAAEFEHTRIEVSLLEPAQPMNFCDEADALSQLQPGVDGIILSYRAHRATFLPQVWDTLHDPGRFLAHLKQKAGLAPDFWSPELKLERYRVHKWKENHPLPTAGPSSPA